MKRALIIAALALAATAPTASAWTSSVFHSPSGNIRCSYRFQSSSVACATAVPQRSVTLTVYGVPKVGRGWLPLRGPVLAYGAWVGNELFTCGSFSWGITCESIYSGHGFTIAREGVTRW